jgi:uncharacterized membrane-anchored protein YhcB (DUF1043 family)
MYEQHQELTAGQALATIIGCIIVWMIIFFIVKKFVNKKITSQKKISSPVSDFNKKFFDELQFNYHIKETSSAIEITSNKFDDLITNGKIIIEIQSVGADKKITMTYSRKLKGIGFIVILFSIMLCYIGVIIPYLIMQETKKKAMKEMDNIFYSANSIQ